MGYPGLLSSALLGSTLLCLPLWIGCAGAAPPPDCANVAAATPAPAAGDPPWPDKLDHESTPRTQREAVAELFEVTRMSEVLDMALEQAMDTQMKVKPELRRFEGVMRKFMGKYMSMEALREPMTRLYVERFTELEIRQLSAFYRTPLGQRTHMELPKLMAEGSKIGMMMVQDHMDELVRMIREELESGGAGEP